MTIGELIEQLNTLDHDLPVVFQDNWGKTWGVEDMVQDTLTNMLTDEEEDCAILLDRVLPEVV